MTDEIFTNTFVKRPPWNREPKGNKIERWTFQVQYLNTNDRGPRPNFWKSDPVYQPENFYDNKASAEQGNYKYLSDATSLELLGQESKRKLKITYTNPKLKIFLISMSNFQYFFYLKAFETKSFTL